MRTALTSSMGKEAAVGISIGKELNISDRPVTNQGMRGIKTANGPGRGVQAPPPATDAAPIPKHSGPARCGPGGRGRPRGA